MGLSKQIRLYFEKKKRLKNTINDFTINVQEPDLVKETLVFPETKQPLVSIIIPYYNMEATTRACIKSIHQNLPENSFELLLINDCSQDAIDFSDIHNTVQITNDTNLGFLESVNKGIRIAKGDFIYLLNNDTLVYKGFLDELVNVFNTKEDVGAVGSMILNTDGSLQEAGSLFLSAERIHQVNNVPAYFPEVNYVYEVDYASGCSLLFRKTDDLGNLNLLDPIYKPAYFEETDLCFRIRYDQGKKIYFSPFSKVIHFDGLTYKNKSQEKALQKEMIFKKNKEIFYSRWGKYLDKIKSNTVEERKLEINNNKQIIFFHDQMPKVDNNSGEIRFTEIMKEFCELGYEVTLITTQNKFENDSNEFYQKLGICVVYEHHGKNDVVQFLKRSVFHQPIVWFHTAISFNKYYKTAQKFIPNGKVIFDMVDIHHLRFKRALEFEENNKELQKLYKKFYQYELEAAEKADIVIPISEQEKVYMGKFCENRKLHVISNIHYPRIKKEETPRFQDRSGILFVGSKHTPNIDAVNYLIDEIMPEVWKVNPAIKLHVVGDLDKHIDEEKKTLKNVVFHGFVEDIEPFYLNTKYMIAPLRYGAGVKGKIGQAFEYYLPVITNKIGAEGMNLQDGINILDANTTEKFAEQILRLYNDEVLWKKLQDNSEKSLRPFSVEKLKGSIQFIESYRV